MLGKEDMKKMGPAIMIALAKKKGNSDGEGESEKGDEMDKQEYLEEISSDLIAAVHDKDSAAVADLLKEAFECLSSDKEDY